MSSSGLIYAVIVGAWAAYLVPMWLRRQDELNESRPTERFTTAIRLLAGRSALERRASRTLGDDDPTDPATDGASDGGAVGVPADSSTALPAAAAEPVRSQQPDRRAQLLARRRRMVTLLFGAFALGAVLAAVAGVAFLWVPALPAVLLTLYIGHLRRLERQRCEVKLDRVRAAAAAQHVREREHARAARLAETAPMAAAEEATEPIEPAQQQAQAGAAEAVRPESDARQDLVEATDHEEWVDGLRERAAAGPDSWEPVPVPLPTYVTAPVAPRVNRGLEHGGPPGRRLGETPGTWTSGRPAAEAPHTPLFDQYQDPPSAFGRGDPHLHARPRAANE